MENITGINFEHNMSAHCENGVTSNLFSHHGVKLSEAMVFGIGAGLFFVHFPLMKMNGTPITAYRPMPGQIFSRVSKAIGAKVTREKFSFSPEKSMKQLDKILKEGIPVGMLVGVFNLTYFPTLLRFHFNAHNIVAYQKVNDKYLISDPVMETPEWLSYNDLMKVRYAKGAYKPKGRMYYISSVNNDFSFAEVIENGIRSTAKSMVKYQGPFVGIRGIKLLAKNIKKWPVKYTERKASLYLSSVIRMQEEIGTGGAGFRFLYAAFLQEASVKLNNNILAEASLEMTIIGDMWRKFAVDSGRVCKKRTKEGESYNSVSDLLIKIADREEILFNNLLNIKLT